MSEQWTCMKGYLYILQSLKNRSYYIGSTKNVELRLKQHNAGAVKATRHKGPYKLVFQQEFVSIVFASRAEKRVKGWKRRDYIEKMIRSGKYYTRP